MNQKLLIVCIASMFLGACASVPHPPLRMEPGLGSTDPLVERGQGSFEGARGIKLYTQWWRPKEEAKAVLMIVHGLKDHGSRYSELAGRLVREGFAVYALDLRGHAHSEGERVYIEQFSDYLEDLEAFHADVARREPGKALFLFGHSMGGAIVTLYTLTRSPALAGLVTHAGALEVDASWVTVLGVKTVAAVAPRSKVFQLDLEKFSRNPEVVRLAKADPLVSQGAAPARTARELLAGIDQLGQHLEELELPLLVMHGTADEVTPPNGSQELYRRASSKDKTLKLYPNLVHDLVHEPEKEQVIDDLVGWLSQRAMGAPAGQTP